MWKTLFVGTRSRRRIPFKSVVRDRVRRFMRYGHIHLIRRAHAHAHYINVGVTWGLFFFFRKEIRVREKAVLNGHKNFWNKKGTQNITHKCARKKTITTPLNSNVFFYFSVWNRVSPISFSVGLQTYNTVAVPHSFGNGPKRYVVSTRHRHRRKNKYTSNFKTRESTAFENRWNTNV